MALSFCVCLLVFVWLVRILVFCGGAREGNDADKVGKSSLCLREEGAGEEGGRKQDLLAKLLALVGGELGGAGAHDCVGG